MNKFGTVLLLVCTLSACGAEPPSPSTLTAQALEPGLVLNGGFEDGEQHWQENEPSAVTTVVAQGAFQGKYALEVRQAWAGRKQTVSLLPNSVYTLTAQARSTDGQPCVLHLKGEGENPSGDVLTFDENVSAASSGYSLISKTLNTPAVIRWAVVLVSGQYRYVPNGDAGQCYFDDIKLERVGGVPGDHSAPSRPENLVMEPLGGRVKLNWRPSSDDVGVVGYDVFDGGARRAQVTATQVELTDVAPGRTTLRVRARDAAGNLSRPAEIALTIPAPSLLKNGDFEGGGEWSLYPGSSLEAGQGRSGSKGLKLVGNWSGALQAVQAQPETAYQLSGWIRSLAGRNCTLTFKGDGSSAWNAGVSSNAPDWTRVEKTVTTASSVYWAQVFPEGSECLFDDIQVSPADSSNKPWTLAWSDEFGGTTLDSSKWTAVDAPVGINNELPYFRPQNAYLENGNLVIKTDKQAYGGREYTSAHLNTRGKFEFKYGRLEVRALLPTGRGVKPDMWTLHPNCRGYDNCEGFWPPEFDLLEMLGQDTTTVYQTFHYGSFYHARWPYKTGKLQAVTVSDSSSNWHTFALEWEPGESRLYTDGVLTQRLNERELGYVAYDEPMFFILDTTVGGDWAGSPDASTTFPQFTRIDYVRFYKR